MKNKKVLMIAISGIIVVCIIWMRLSLEPTIKPEDIELTGILHEKGNEPNVFTPFYLSIQLNNQSGKPLCDEENYFYFVYPYVDGPGTGIYDFDKGWSEGKPLGKEEFLTGSDGRTEGIAVNKLMQLGILPPGIDQKPLNPPEGFQYCGQEFPVTARLHVAKLEKPLRKENMVLVYAHYEKKWGKDLSWVKTFPIEMQVKMASEVLSTDFANMLLITGKIPDENSLNMVFATTWEDTDKNEIWSVDLTGKGQPLKLADGRNPRGFRGGVLYVSEQRRLMYLPPGKGEAYPVLKENRDFLNFDLSADKTALAIVLRGQSGCVDIAVLNLDSSECKWVVPPKETYMPSIVTFQPYASVSNGGGSVAYFATDSTGHSMPAVWFSDTGTSRFLLTEPLYFYLLLTLRNEPLDGKLLAISPDGEEVAIAYTDNGRLDGPHLISTAGDGKDRLLRMHISPRGFAWSDDGKKVAYWGGQGSGAEYFTVDIFERESGRNISTVKGVQDCVFLDNNNLFAVRLEGEPRSSSCPALVNLEGYPPEIIPGLEKVFDVAK